MTKKITALYSDIARFMQMSEEQLAFVLAAWCSYRSADGGLVELLVDHVHALDHGYCREMKRSYYKSRVERFPFVEQYPHHVLAATLASCKYECLNHPELVSLYLQMNDDIPLHKLLDKIERHTGSKLEHSKIPA